MIMMNDNQRNYEEHNQQIDGNRSRDIDSMNRMLNDPYQDHNHELLQQPQQEGYIDPRDRNLKPYQGILFILGIFISYLGLSFGLSLIMPRSLSFYATILLQLWFIAAPLLFVICMKRNLRRVFPFHKPAWSGIGGTVVLWIGTFMVNIAMSGTLSYLFPAASGNTSMQLWEMIADIPAILLILVIAVMPAIGEELTFRGVFLNSLTGIRYPILAALLVGIVFGAFHMDLVKLLPTGMIGILLCVMLQDSGNMIYNSFLHFLNNFVSVALLILVRAMAQVIPAYDQLMEQSLQQSAQMTLAGVGLYWIMGCAGPFLIYLGLWLVKRTKKNYRKSFFPKETRARDLILVIGATVLMLFIGFLCLVIGVLQMTPYIG